MTLSPQVTFRNVPPSDALSAYVQAKAEKLSTFSRSLTSCRVAIEAPHHSQKHGNTYRVRIDVGVPGAHLAVGDHHAQSPSHTDAYAAVDDAFKAAERVVKAWADRREAERRETTRVPETPDDHET